jgi:hypothetical protein
MAEVTTWVTVADTAVKVGLGALIGGGISIVASYLSQERDRLKDYNNKKRDQLLEIALRLNKFNRAFGLYWATVSNAIFKKRERKEPLSRKDRAVLREQEAALFETFALLTECKTSLLLLGYKQSCSHLDEFAVLAQTFFAESNIDNEKTTQQNLDVHKRKLEIQRGKLMDSLHEHYKSDN